MATSKRDVGSENEGYTAFQVYECPRCLRLWVLCVAVGLPPGRAEDHDAAIYRNLLGTVHFAERMKSYVLCDERPAVVERPAVMTAYHLGGQEAVDELGGRKHQACPT